MKCAKILTWMREKIVHFVSNIYIQMIPGVNCRKCEWGILCTVKKHLDLQNISRLLFDISEFLAELLFRYFFLYLVFWSTGISVSTFRPQRQNGGFVTGLFLFLCFLLPCACSSHEKALFRTPIEQWNSYLNCNICQKYWKYTLTSNLVFNIDRIWKLF